MSEPEGNEQGSSLIGKRSHCRGLNTFLWNARNCSSGKIKVARVCGYAQMEKLISTDFHGFSLSCVNLLFLPLLLGFYAFVTLYCWFSVSRHSKQIKVRTFRFLEWYNVNVHQEWWLPNKKGQGCSLKILRRTRPCNRSRRQVLLCELATFASKSSRKDQLWPLWLVPRIQTSLNFRDTSLRLVHQNAWCELFVEQVPATSPFV